MRPLLAHDRYCDEIAHQVSLLRSVVTSGADLSGTVRTCPEWSLEDLVRHMGGALRWVELMVRTRAEAEVPEERVPGAAGLPYEVAPEVAADALDEWLQIVEYVQRTVPHDAARELRGPGRSIHLHATDTGPEVNAEWLVELTEDGVAWRRGHEKATVALRGPLTSVLPAFYRRLPLDAPELEVLGERELLEFWLERATLG
jgi:hypothetical protein